MQQQIMTLPDGRKLGFAEYGDSRGKAIFYFHGTPGSRLEAGRFNDIAFAKQIRLIGIDRPGMGLSSIDRNRSILSWAMDVAHFADYLGIMKFSIIGHSGGGPFVAATALALPERINGAAIVSGMAPLYKPESQIGMSRSQILMYRMIKNMPWLAIVMMKLNLILLKNPDKLMRQMLEQLPEADKVVFRDPKKRRELINCTIEAFKNGAAGPALEMKLLCNSWGFELENIKTPISIWQGNLDKQAPISHAKIFANLIPNSQLKILENEGHLSILSNYIDKIFESVCL